MLPQHTPDHPPKPSTSFAATESIAVRLAGKQSTSSRKLAFYLLSLLVAGCASDPKLPSREKRHSSYQKPSDAEDVAAQAAAIASEESAEESKRYAQDAAAASIKSRTAQELAEKSQAAAADAEAEIKRNLERQRKADILDRARIYNIGVSNVLTFEVDEKFPDKSPEVLIPVFGRGLCGIKGESSGEPINQLQVQLTGTIPVGSSDYSVGAEAGTAENMFEIRLHGSYVRKLKTGDRLDIIVMLNRKGDSQVSATHPVACAQRSFTFYSVEDYRKILSRKIPLSDIQAFPLPQDEAEDLFGRVIANNFFVVKLTLQNNDLSAEERLVNVGMISASGRLLVEPARENEPSFTLPVKISPQSPIQVFSILESREETQPRAWIFRSLEFAGALSTAYITSFSSSEDATKAAALATGVAIPELNKLWPDKWPSYKRNLVNFGMPELVKVPKSASTTPRFIFFSKNDLELVVSDPKILDKGATADPKGLWNNFKVGFHNIIVGEKVPTVRVLSLSFDSLEIPFENVLPPSEADLREEVMLLQSDLTLAREQLDNINREWPQGQIGLVNISSILATRDLLKNAGDIVNALIAKNNQKTGGGAIIKSQLEELRYLADIIGSIPDPQNELHNRILSNQSNGLSRGNINTAGEQLSITQRRLLSGSHLDSHKDRVETIRNQVRDTRAIIDFIETTAEILTGGQDMKLPEAATALANVNTSNFSDMEALLKDKEIQKAARAIGHTYETLKAMRTTKIAPSFAPASYKALN